MPIVKKEEPKTKKRMSGAARRSRAKQYKSGNTNNVVKSVSKDTRVARYIKQDVKKNAEKPKDQQALVPVTASRKVKKTANVQEAIKSQAFDIVRQKLVASLMQILPQTNEGNWNNNSNVNNQGPMDSWSNNNNYNNNNMNNGGWGNNSNTNNNNNMNQGGFWSSANNNNNNNNMNQGVPNMQGGWNNNSNNNSNSQARWNNNNNNSNNNRVASNSQGAWNNNNNNNNNSGRSVSNSGGVWSSSSNSNLNNNMSSAWSNNPQRSQSGMNNKNNISNTSVWDAPCPEAPAPPRWNNNLSDSTLRNGGNLNQNQNLNQMGNLGGGGSNWNGSGNLATSMWSNDPRNAGGREYFEGQQMGGNDSYFNEQQNFDEYEQSSAELKFAIMDMNMPGGKIVGRRQQLLKSAFNQALADVVLNADRRFPPIQIKFSRFIQDTYKISVASRRCVEVLQNLVDRLPSLWPGSKLRLVAFQPRVKLEKASVYIRSGAIGRTSEEILLILERQNAGLRTDRWHVFHKKEKEDGVLLIVGIDKQSMDFLEMVEGRVFFLTSNAFFKLGKKPIGLGSNGGTGNVNNNNNNNKNKPSPQSRQRNQNRKK